MEKNWLERTELLVKDEGLARLKNANILIVGLGGVGSFAAEFIARAGVGRLTIVDGDTVDRTNRNRQLPALITTEGLYKVDVMTERLLAINPELQLTPIQQFINPTDVDALVTREPFDYVVDAIDSVTPKLLLIQSTLKHKIPLISSMGAGGKFDPTKLKVVDISETHECAFAACIRKRLKRLNIRTGFKAVFSTEVVLKESLMLTDGKNYKRSAYGTISYLPAAFGGVCASVVIRDLLSKK